MDTTSKTPSLPIRRAGIEFSPRRFLTLPKVTQPTPQGREKTPNGAFAADTGIDNRVKFWHVAPRRPHYLCCKKNVSLLPHNERGIKASASRPLPPAPSPCHSGSKHNIDEHRSCRWIATGGALDCAGELGVGRWKEWGARSLKGEWVN